MRGLCRDSPGTKGGNEYAVLVITLYPSQFVFQCVLFIIKLPKQETNERNSSQGVGGGRRRQKLFSFLFFIFFLITKLPSVRKPFLGRLAIYKADEFQEMKLLPKTSTEKESRSIGQLLGVPEFHNRWGVGGREVGCRPGPARKQLRWDWVLESPGDKRRS